MKSQTSYIFLAPGFEEIEALATVDAMRRAGMKVVEVAVADTKSVTGATGQTVVADSLLADIDPADAEWPHARKHRLSLKQHPYCPE